MESMRIPEFSEKNMAGMVAWFEAMSDLDLLFHPDDSACDIVSIASGEPLFSSAECHAADEIVDEMFKLFGDDVYEAAYPSFMKAMAIQ